MPDASEQLAQKPLTKQELQQLLINMQDQKWRLSNLYWIRDRDGIVVKFKPNWGQLQLFPPKLALRNLILKGRKLGVTTGFCIFWLDTALNHSNVTIGIVADTIDNASAWMRDIIVYAYRRLPPEVLKAVTLTGENATELRFSNDSSISVGVTYRGSITPQILHISELGYISQKQPKRAEEIQTGAVQSVPANGIIVVESTAAGRTGYFYDLCQTAQKGIDWKFFFLPWYDEPLYVKSDERVLEYKIDADYLDQLELKIGRKLPQERRNWWCWKRRELGDKMFSEFPSTPEEAFKQSTEGAYYGRQMLEAWQGGRITKVPVDRHLGVETWWDIGRDTTSIWFVQRSGYEIRLVDYYHNSGEWMVHYANYIGTWRRANNIEFVSCIGPHDLERTSWDTGDGRMQTAMAAGLHFQVVPRGKIADRVEAVRKALPRCVFDEERCAAGIKGLEHYRKKWNPVLGMWNEEPMHDWASHPADAFGYGIQYNASLGGLTGMAGQGRIVARPVQHQVWR